VSANSRIEWTTHTLNPWWGCEKVSPACKLCYAETWAKRTGHQVWGGDSPRRFFGEKHWAEPLKWNRKAGQAKERARVFCSSMSDILEIHRDAEVAHRQMRERRRLGHLIEITEHLDWLLLTKRLQDGGRCFTEMFGDRGKFPKNVWIGTTMEDQDRAQERAPRLCSLTSTVRFVSAEPLLGRLSLRDLDVGGYLAERYPIPGEFGHIPVRLDALTGSNDGQAMGGTKAQPVDWVIAGGESGPGARPTELSWFRDLRDECADAGVPFFMKQITERGRKIPFDDWPDDLKVRQFPEVRA